MTRSLALIAALAALTVACQKDPPVETVPPAVIDRTATSAGENGETGETGTEGAEAGESAEAADGDAPAAGSDQPTAPENASAPAYPDEVRPPRADDLSHYVEGLDGAGALLATIATSMGEIRCELYEEKTPITVANFVGLARGIKPFRDPRTGDPVNRPFYDGLIFHRVIPTFMIQGGDPMGNGSGGPGYQFGLEIHPLARHGGPGTLAMANAGPDTNGSQFYITETAKSQLNDKYTVFGRCKNISVVRDIARVETGGQNRPARDVRIERITISRGTL
jgi:peptidyl-prolyl cis-trans isomerase A (cyclophilin A)